MKHLTLTAAALLIGLTGSATAQNTRDTIMGAISVFADKNAIDIDAHFSEPYIQHNQSVPTGLAAFKGLVDQAVVQNPAFNYDPIRVIIDGDIGIVHGLYTGFGPAPLVAFDVFRVENGRVVEHWDNLAPVAEPNASGRTQTDGATEVTDLDQTEANKSLVRSFMTEVLIGGDFARLPEFFDGDNYLQHNSNIADGLSGLSAGLQALADAGVQMRIETLHFLHGEGNFVLAMSEGDISGQPTAFYDLFRVENGKIAEHWDVISPILPDAEAANTNGKF